MAIDIEVKDYIDAEIIKLRDLSKDYIDQKYVEMEVLRNELLQIKQDWTTMQIRQNSIETKLRILSGGNVISKVGFIERFTESEYQEILLQKKTDPKLELIIEKIMSMDKVDLDANRIGDALDYMVLMGIISEQRKSDIITL